MWLFSRKKRTVQGILSGLTDYHSHILPGVDDGVETLDDALRVLHFYEEMGVEAVWLTPHIMEDVPNTLEFLRERFAELCAAYSGSIRLYLSSENMLDSLFEKRLQTNELLPFGDKADHLLVETSYFNAPMGLGNILMRIRTKGYYPVLAHPERYMYMDKADYQQLRENGVKFQLNILSPLGYYGKRVQDKSQWLLKQKMYDFKGSDLHDLETFREAVTQKAKKINKLINQK